MSFFDSKWYFIAVVLGTVGLPLFMTKCAGFSPVHDPDYQECGAGPFKFDC